MSDKKFKVGDKVKYVGSEHEINPQWFPIIGTIGTVMQDVDEFDCYIQWQKGSTSKEDRWYCNKNDVELVEDEDMTNEEIWKMLEPKMRKNGLKPCGSRLLLTNGIANVYAWEDVHNAIALAYKVGYLRSQKGRPFKIGENKKKGGHWKPVDPNNLPKEGMKVRYSRECKDYVDSDECICINDTGVVKLEGSWFGMTLDNPHRYEWICFDDAEDSLDMWVEDDE